MGEKNLSRFGLLAVFICENAFTVVTTEMIILPVSVKDSRAKKLF